MHPRSRYLVAGLVAVFAAGCHHNQPTVAAVPRPAPPAPDYSFTVAVETTRGPLVLLIHRDWAPIGVDRFYALLRARYYDNVAVFRVVPKFVVQFGLAADPSMTARYRHLPVDDDSVRHSNLRGTVTFARGGPNSRTTQIFINLVDNTRLDASNGFGFPPIGVVATGMDHVDQFNAQYSATTPNQDSIVRQGNSYLKRAYPKLDYIVRMAILREWRAH